MKGIFTVKWRKRKFQTFFLIAFIIVIYFLLQFFSLSKLGSVNSLKKAPEHSDHVFDAVVEDRRIGAFELDLESDQESEETLKSIPPRGVLLQQADHYYADSDGMFKCLNSKQKVPVTRVNDDFCDCPDSSDEPGTNACPDARFYCTIQIPHQEAQFIHSSKVNDGICDCCDGSDEWANVSVPSNMRLYAGRPGAVFHSPCLNHCGNIEKQLEDERRIRRLGQQLMEPYLLAAQNLTVQQRKKFGPHGIFYLLSKQCFDYKTPSYTYSICPFEVITQSGGRKTVLGRHGVWLQQKKEDYVLKMGGGDADLCPEGQPRQVLIRFLCGLEDRVVDVDEDQLCLYVVRVSTPAAC